MDEINQNSFINDSINESQKEIIDIQDSTIKKLNTQLSIYKKQLKDQREELFSCDNLIINFNSLNNSYIKLKKENEILLQKLYEKNQIINEYQTLFFESKSKILLFNQLNEIFQEKINFILDIIPNDFFQNFDINQKLIFFDSKLQKIKEEFSKKEEELKNKLYNKSINQRNYNNINEIQRKISELEFELSISKKLNEDYAKEKEEINKISNDIFNVKNEVSKEINEYINENRQLKEENEYLTDYFDKKGKEMQNLLLNIKQGNNNINKELSQKNEIINNLMKDKDILYKENQKLNSEFITLKILYNKKYHKLKNLVDNIEKEKDEREIEINEENLKLKEEIKNYKKELENYKTNEDKYLKQIDELKIIIKNLENDKNEIKNIYETCFYNNEDKLLYSCDYCNCKHVLCKDCLNLYLNSN